MAWAVPMIGGSIAGLVLIGVVFIAIMRRRSALCPSYREGNTVTVSNNEGFSLLYFVVIELAFTLSVQFLN